MNLQHEYIKETNKSYLRKNKKNHYFLDYEIKKEILLSYEPFKIISFKTTNEIILEAYLYEKEDKIIVVISQINDLNYSKILILNKNDDVLFNIKNCIKDDRGKDIIRISHTTKEKFYKILDIIFEVNKISFIRK